MGRGSKLDGPVPRQLVDPSSPLEQEYYSPWKKVKISDDTLGDGASCVRKLHTPN